ncbi:MAG: hypothetical protein ACOYIS_00290 [Candidatus Cloacimonadaceae bacterium]|jgi:hypothetical protein
MSKTNSETAKGLKNSSKTRVKPFFSYLFKNQGNGAAWLPNLLGMVTKNKDLADMMSNMDCNVITRTEKKKSNNNSSESPAWEDCFEYSLHPSRSLLRWMIEHPDELTWPRKNGVLEKFERETTQPMRESLIFPANDIDRKKAQQEALKLLEEKGPQKSRKKWWAFEGFTSIDCLLETKDFILAIEGKRTDSASQTIEWYPKRNQIIRNLEAVKEKAGSKPYAVLLMNKDGKDPVKDAHFTDSLPHYSQQEINELKKRYLGAVSWEQACKAVGIDLNDLPDTIYDI